MFPGLRSRQVRRLMLAMIFVLIGLSGGTPVFAQTFVCDSTCSPDPTSSTYGPTFNARFTTKNVRGPSSVLATRAEDTTTSGRGASLPGSESYTYAIPILDLPGRNGLNAGLTLYYNSAVWTIDTLNGTATFNADRDFPSYGFRLSYGMIEAPPSGDFSFVLTEPDGTKRELRPSSGSTYVTVDSSYIDWNTSTLVLRRKDGTQWFYQAVAGTNFFRPIEILDTNGNFISITYNNASGVPIQAIATITDTVNRVISFNYDATSTPKLQSITVTPPGGSPKTVAYFNWGAVALNYSFTLAVPNTQGTGSSINVLTSCAYPNAAGTGPGMSYAFTYGDWGMVTKVSRVSANGTTRSYERYDYLAASAGPPLSDHPTYQNKFVSADGSSESKWTYAVTKTSGLTSSFAVTDPAGTTTTTNLFTSTWQTGLPSTVTVSSGATTLRTISNTFTQGNLLLLIPINPSVTVSSTTLNDSGQVSSVSFGYDTNGNVADLTENDYTGPTRRTHTNYVTDSDHISRHILDRPSQVLVYDASNNLKARTDLAYDGGTLTGVTGAPQHDDTNYSSTFLTRGNVTSITRYTNAAAGSGAITRNFTYDFLGNLLTAQLDCCQSKQWSFSSATGFAYPDSVTRGGGSTTLTTSTTYDLGTGLVTSTSDENSQVVHYAYDALSRLTSASGPLGVSISNSYDDNSAQPAITATTAVDTGKNILQIETSDGLGRVVNQRTQDAASQNASIVETQYDALGRVTQVSNPHGTSEAAVFTQNQYDALGRVVMVIPPDGSAAANNAQYTYSGNVTTSTDPTGKQRVAITDALGRLVQVREPGYADSHTAQGSLSISGSEQTASSSDPNCTVRSCTIYDIGGVQVTINGFSKIVNYGQGSNISTIASAIATALNGDTNSPVTASASSGAVTLTSKATGSIGDYSLSATSWTNDPTDFSGPSFTAGISGGTLTGGTDGTGADGSQLLMNTPFYTLYTYDPLDNITTAAQGGVQTRTNAYDSLGNLTSSTAPEAGTVSYTYNSFSLVSTRTDARGVVATYSYDGLNRLQQMSYNVSGATGVPATPAVTYTYGTSPASNNNGRLISMTDGTGSEAYTYDALGRVSALTKTIGGTAYPLSYTYDIASHLKTVTYPSGRVVAQSFDTLQRLNQVSSGGTNYVASVTYNSAWQPTGMTYGNSVTASYSYNSRMQLASLAYANTACTFFSLTYGYAQNGGNNGQITGITDNGEPGRTANYTYDVLGRLKSAQTTGSANYPAWGLSWSYDHYGNRQAQTVTAGSGPSNSVNVDHTTNRLLAPYTYDLAGNMTGDGANVLAYDGENRLATSTSGGVSSAYLYDGNGLRVSKQVGSNAPTAYIFSGAKVVAEYASGVAVSSPSKEYIYSGSRLLATLAGSSTTYHHADHLSVRVNTDSIGNILGKQGHFPFGESWYAVNATTKWQFTSYERDSESGNDYAMARTYVNRLSRFSSIDSQSGSTGDPQSLNRYTYARNDPIDFVDPSGATCIGFFVIVQTVDAETGELISSQTIGFIPIYCTGGWDWETSNSGGGGGGASPADKISEAFRVANLLLSDKDCAEFLKMILTKGGFRPNLDSFYNNLHASEITPNPKGEAPSRDYTAHVHAIGQTDKVHVDQPSDPQLAQVLLHEAFHGIAYAMTDAQLAQYTTGSHVNPGPGLTEDQALSKNSKAASKEFRKHCNPSKIK